ncbi:methyl-accepting chemotaxis protein [Rhizobium paranaense]|uniref:Methyl-accepting chemotaxis protein n=1 Tax=Rhizobium paranaense TaxID=1650438 RepID=A0A7W8XUR2_9HYPH|nr:methyl-accepting chemotaxis protein [Rhizobium paranaense]MBB5575775.1 methyl-accepting chemotaxis protein [Rhizobium paranaense]
MSFLQNTKIRTKILSVIIPICLVGIAGIIAMSQNYKAANDAYSGLLANDGSATIQMARASQRVVALSYNAYQVLAYNANDPEMPGFVKNYGDNKKALFDWFKSIRSLVPEQAASVDVLADKAKAITAITDKAVEAGAKDDESAKGLLKQADPLIADEIVSVRQWIESSNKNVKAESDSLTSQTNHTILYTLTTLGIVFVAAIAAGLFIAAKGITTPIEKLRERMVSLAGGETETSVAGLGRKDEVGQMAAAVAVFRDNAIERIRLERDAEANRSLSERERMERDAQKAREAAETEFAVKALADGLGALSDGNLTYRIEKPFVGHLDQLRSDFNGSITKMQQALRAVGDNARGIDAGANEIRSAADDLSKRTEQQAASVEETAAALEQITTTVKDSTRRAEEAGHLVAQARIGAEKSGVVMREAVAAMEGIEKSSSEISNIIGVIDEIAFQTNLLALNAGVEAARAGEAGKGFAVVAQEVRELAQRSAQAAKEIKALISTSSNQVRNGVELVARTGQSLSQIVQEVEEIDANVRAIVEAAREQSTGLAEINTAVNAIDQGTQQNAAMVEQSTAASHSLAKEVASLNNLLGQFNVAAGDKQPPLAMASERHQPAVSPARSLRAKIAGAFNGGAATAAAASKEGWEEF